MIDVRTLTCGLFLLRYLVVDRDVILQPEIQLWEVEKHNTDKYSTLGLGHTRLGARLPIPFEVSLICRYSRALSD